MLIVHLTLYFPSKFQIKLSVLEWKENIKEISFCFVSKNKQFERISFLHRILFIVFNLKNNLCIQINYI